MHRLVFIVLVVGFTPVGVAHSQGLEQQLLAEGAENLAAAAHKNGDSARGAVVFHQAFAACSRCHTVDGSGMGVGPDLTTTKDPLSDVNLVESILEPSKRIRAGYETISILTTDGQIRTGILKSTDNGAAVLKDPAGNGQELRIPRSEIDEQVTSPLSVMPAGVANQLTSRQQFLDLTRYLLEIRDGGPTRAKELQPPPSAYALQLPEYEGRVDHAGLIRSLDDAALDRGKAIYTRVCRNCHGTHDEPGSLPTSLRFASGTFKAGSDPFSMYRTLTHGFGQMTPQTWMVPQQKYDVIHYLREAYLRSHNASQHFPIDEKYLAGLPAGDTRGPAPSKLEPWSAMDYGPSLTHTYEFGKNGSNFAYKGVAVRLDAGAGGVARGKHFAVFDHDTMRIAAAWHGEGFVDWQGIQFDGQHGIHPRSVGDIYLSNPSGPGWANPLTGKFDDSERVVGRDGRRYGPLPKSWARYRGHYQRDARVIFDYTVGDANILEMPGEARTDESAEPVLTRAFRIGPRSTELRLLVASGEVEGYGLRQSGNSVSMDQPSRENESIILRRVAGLSRTIPGTKWNLDGRRICLVIPPGDDTLRFVVWTTRTPIARLPVITLADEAPDLDAVIAAPATDPWPEQLTTTATLGSADGPFAVDVLTHPDPNPWLAQVRLTGLDFFADGDSAAVCSWDGDVWIVRGLTALGEGHDNKLTWKRIANGLFQPLGLKIIDGVIHLTCRDQLVIFRDINGDGATDFYQCLNNDQQVTEHFHEFAMGLQTDAAGNLYYAKSARHALPAVVPQHGTLLRVSPDGEQTEILANGFRAANGVCLNPDGSFFVTDQEGHWNPKNRINWVTLAESGKPKFYGNLFGYHDVTDPSDERMEPPLCWITNAFDRSPAELLWTPKDAWGPLGSRLLNLSYGYGKVYVVPHEQVDGVMQGGMCELPIPPFPTGIMRGRFNPANGHLYVCGMYSWAGSVTQPGGLYRIRHTGRPMHLPAELHARPEQISITFTDPLPSPAASDPSNYQVKVWSLKRTADYGSKHYDERPLEVRTATLSKDGRVVVLTISDLQPTWCMEIKCTLNDEDGKPFDRTIHNTIHKLAPAADTPPSRTN